MKGITKLMLGLVMWLIFVAGKVGGQGGNAQAQAQAHAQAHQDLIQTVCQKTPSKDLCVNTLTSSNPSQMHATVKDLAIIFMRVASKNASEIIGQLKELIENDKLAPKVQQGLSDCKDMLLDAADQLDIAVSALLKNAAQDAQKWLQVALDATNICAASLKGQEDVMLKKNDAFRQLCVIAFDICTDLASGA